MSTIKKALEKKIAKQKSQEVLSQPEQERLIQKGINAVKMRRLEGDRKARLYLPK